ncbi:MAG: 3-oxoacyl-ACP synthase, partial [Patescibacteria group bacterium]|nr:3-oxoacyl-ACP synthase [Patescibacteria group bacterium]
LELANGKIIKAVAESLGVAMEKVIVIINKYGNTLSSSIPIALCEAVNSGKIRRNHMIATASFGAGIAFGAAVLPMVGLPKS